MQDKEAVTGRVLLFKVVSEGREYSMFTNGQIEGFPSPAIVVNYFDLLVARAFHERDHHQRTLSVPLPMEPDKV